MTEYNKTMPYDFFSFFMFLSEVQVSFDFVSVCTIFGKPRTVSIICFVLHSSIKYPLTNRQSILLSLCRLLGLRSILRRCAWRRDSFHPRREDRKVQGKLINLFFVVDWFRDSPGGTNFKCTIPYALDLCFCQAFVFASM